MIREPFIPISIYTIIGDACYSKIKYKDGEEDDFHEFHLDIHRDPYMYLTIDLLDVVNEPQVTTTTSLYIFEGFNWKPK